MERHQQTTDRTRPRTATTRARHAAALWLAAALCLLSACDSFLEEQPKGQLQQDEAYASLADLQNNTVLAIYHTIGGNQDSQGLQGTGRGVFDFNSLTTDEAIMPTRGGDWYDGGFWQTLFRHTWVEGTASMKDMWDYLFRSVMLCNDYLERVEAYRKAHPDDDTAAFTAELRGVRALFYFYLMDLFGRVPIVESTQLPTSQLVQARRSEVFRFVTDELLAALPLLPDGRSNQPGDNYGRLTKPVAWFLMAKLTLNAEVYTHDDWTSTQRPDGANVDFVLDGRHLNAWQTCAACCDSIAARGYELESDFAYNFSPTNEDSRENIFTIPMDPVRYANWYCYFFRSRHYSHGAVLGGASENGTSATQELLDAFGYGTEHEDPRFALTFYAGTVTEGGQTVCEDDGKTPLVYHPRQIRLDLTGSPYEKTAGARLRKYANDPDANADGRACNNDIVLFRYADVLLMKAEALARQGLDGSAPLNEVRARVGLPAVQATLQSILDERFVELAWEGWRRNDLVRYGLFTRSYTDRPQNDGEQDGHTSVFPIPGDLLVMHPAWTQNPGY